MLPSSQKSCFLFQESSEDEKLLDDEYVSAFTKNAPQGTNKTPNFLRNIVKSVPER